MFWVMVIQIAGCIFAQPQSDNRLQGHSGCIRSIAFFPDGKKIVSGGADGQLRLWDLGSKKSKLVLSRPNADVTAVAVHPSEDLFVAGYSDGLLLFFTSKDLGKKGGIQTGTVIFRVLFSPNGKLFAASAGKDIGIWKMPSGELIGSLKGHTNSVACLDFSPDSSKLVSGDGDGDGVLKVWDIEKKSELHSIPLNGGVILDAVFINEHMIAHTGSKGLAIRDWKTNKIMFRGTPDEPITVLRYFEKTKTLVVGTNNSSIGFIDVSKFKVRNQWKVPYPVSALSISPTNGDIVIGYGSIVSPSDSAENRGIIELVKNEKQ